MQARTARKFRVASQEAIVGAHVCCKYVIIGIQIPHSQRLSEVGK